MAAYTSDPWDTELGQSIPPHGPHTITIHAAGWQQAIRFRDGDFSLIMQMKSMYPRFSPFGVSAKFVQSLAPKLNLPEGYTCAAFPSPDVWAVNQKHATSTFREEKHRVAAEDLRYYVMDIAGIRLYLVAFPMAKMMGAIFMWQHGGLGFGTRLSESLMPHAADAVVVGEYPGGADPPAPTYFPEVESHARLRERIAGLVMRATPVAPRAPVRPDDVFLYQTGMAAIVRLHQTISALRPATTVVFGAVFHSSWHIFEESPGGIKHYGTSTDADIDDFERYLDGGGSCSYVFTEFPSNPILVSVNLKRLRNLADKHGFYIVVDDTVAGFGNIDLLPVADALATSLTKSFSGYADVMAGSVTLNPGSKAAYDVLRPALEASFHNELFSGDADVLLSNSNDFLERTAVLNSNAAALAACFAAEAADPASPVKAVHYPPHTKGTNYLQEFLRSKTPELPEPGYGCLLSVELRSLDQTIAFYDNLRFHHGPHLGAHRTLAVPYNILTYSKEHPEYHKGYGLTHEQIRLSVGLEDTETLLATVRAALDKAREVPAAAADKAAAVEEKVANDGDIKTGFDPLAGKAN